MDRFIIEGPTRLSGRVRAIGAKNAALKMMAGALLVEDTVILGNVPLIRDVETMAAVLRTLGMRVDIQGPVGDGVDSTASHGSTFTITPLPEGLSWETPYELVSQMRASIIVLGPLLARLGRAKVAMPGGCNIGHRKIDLHLKGLEALGARFESQGGYLIGYCDKLVGAHVVLDIPSVGATENVMMAAVLAEGETTIENAAREPEIIDLADFLISCGADISGAGEGRITITGVSALHGCTHQVLADRIEAGTYLIAAAATGGDVFIEGAKATHLELVLSKLKEMGCKVRVDADGVGVSMDRRPLATDLITLPYPGLPTDLQAPLMALLSLADGVSIITENVFEGRFTVVEELNRMGADIRHEGHHAVVTGVASVEGVPVVAPDLRGGAALIVAALAAHGRTELQEVYHIDRGYQHIEARLTALGARIERVSPADSADIPAIEYVNE